MAFKSLTFDAIKRTSKFKPSRSVESAFYRALKQVGRASAGIVQAHVHGTKIENQDAMIRALRNYSDALGPWAQRQAEKLMRSIDDRNKKAYAHNSKAISHALRYQVAESDVGRAAQKLVLDQVTLIKSIPLGAGLRAQEIARQAVMEGTRAQPDATTLALLRERLGPTKTDEYIFSRAKTIAITETSKANAALSQARATAVGSSRYIWRNSGDEAVRDAHRIYKGKKLDGQVFEWNNPPTLDDGTTGNPGNFVNCRCYSEAVFDD